MKTAKMYVNENNAGRCILFEYENEWYSCDCAPWDKWGDVDLHSETTDEYGDKRTISLEELATKLREQNEQYTDFSATDFTEEQIGFRMTDVSGMNEEELIDFFETTFSSKTVFVGEVEVSE